jgi:predicted Fe-Mo cluster-binding NifX family protein
MTSLAFYPEFGRGLLGVFAKEARAVLANSLSDVSGVLMRIAVTSQNFRTVTGHAGKTRRFLVFEAGADGVTPVEVERLDLPKSMSLHEYHGDDHPLYRMDVVLTAECGKGFMRRLAAHGVRVIATSELDPVRAVMGVVAGTEPPLTTPHERP